MQKRCARLKVVSCAQVRLAPLAGVPPRLMRAIVAAATAAEAAPQRRLHLFWLTDSIAQNAARELSKPGGAESCPGLHALMDAVEVRSVLRLRSLPAALPTALPALARQLAAYTRHACSAAQRCACAQRTLLSQQHNTL